MRSTRAERRTAPEAVVWRCDPPATPEDDFVIEPEPEDLAA
jgi:hypothetical protein